MIVKGEGRGGRGRESEWERAVLEGERERSGKYVLVLGELLTPLGSPVKLLQFSMCISGNTGLSLELKVERLPEVTVSHCRQFRRKLSTNNTFEIDKSTTEWELEIR